MILVHHEEDFPDGLTSPDVYFTPGYGRAACVTAGGDWVLLEAFDGAWQVPLILRTLVDGMLDAISPYGYSGIYASPSLSSAQVLQAWAATVATLRELGVISVLLRHSPLVTQAPPDLPGLRSIVIGHSTFVLEPVDTDSAWTGLDKHCRNKVRKALKSGYTGNLRRAAGEDVARGSDFRRLYEQTMQRVDAPSRYVFGDDYYQKLVAGLGSNLLVAEVRNGDGAVVASGLRMLHGDRLHAHLAGSNREDARMGTNNLMMWVATQFILDQGLRQFHLGGGVHPGDSISKFKRSFGGRELEFRVSGLIIDEEAYGAQVERRAKGLETTEESLLTSGYFPAYRGSTE
jgi:CelD/BcsL family acetyltransferase involved in cellulose biosynthesis